ncbi:AAA family ATPase [Neptunicella marina]|uniref:ATP-binding protein n=1 Tax=Neptunicella marina TaxID=2125989 RepID=A0A8J6IV07_9ALTE|nr:ATP-binding protein [Neptunicella marina]MBC3767206.1 ATP-binding protein [Neptunicella marina]
MIIDLTVENFLSIKDEQLFSLHADKNLNHLSDNLAYLDTKFATVKSVAIIGGNASGKTNLLFAIRSIRYIVGNTHKFDKDDVINCYDPYLLSDDTKNAPTKLSIEFWVKKVRYQYTIHFDKQNIYFESLYYFITSKSSKIFERTSPDNWKENEGITFGARYKGGRKQFAYYPNMSYLSVAGSNPESPEMLKTVYDFFRENVIFGSESSVVDWEKDEQASLAMKTLMHSVDLGIEDFRFEDVELSEKQLEMIDSVPAQVRDHFLQSISKEVIFSHMHENGTAIEIENTLESKGTMRLFSNFPIVMSALKNGNILIIDEIESSYHAHVVELLIKIFQDPEININNAQLIFSTHAFQIIKSNFMRKDQVWLAEKNNGATNYSSLEQYDSTLRDNSPFDKWYDEGRLGGIPSIDYHSISEVLKAIVSGGEYAAE